jgi:hypothetical protein
MWVGLLVVIVSPDYYATRKDTHNVILVVVSPNIINSSRLCKYGEGVAPPGREMVGGGATLQQ